MVTWRRLFWMRRDVYHHGRWFRRVAMDAEEKALGRNARLGDDPMTPLTQYA